MNKFSGKRRRPQWLLVESATTIVGLVLFWVVPSMTRAFHFKNNGSPSQSHSAGRLWEDASEGTFWSGNNKFSSNSNYKRKKPTTVFLGSMYSDEDERYNANRPLGNHHRRLQFVDTTTPTFVSYSIPTLQPSLAPTLQPSQQIKQGEKPSEAVQVGTTNRPQIPALSKSIKDTPAPFQPLKFAAVPIGFDVLLETESQQDLDEMAQQARQILEDHLFEQYRKGFEDEEGVLVRSVDLNVKAVLTTKNPQQRQRRSLMMESLRRILQLSRAITLEARGVAGFQVNRNAVDTVAFLNDVNTITNDSLEPSRLMGLFQNSTSGLSDYRVASVTNTENPESNGPTIVEIIIAVILIVIMAAGLVAYLCIFLKKRKKRLKRRKQFGVGHKHPSPYKGPPRGRPHGASITPTASPARMINIPAASGSPGAPSFPTGEMNSSSSESSYKGLGSESDEEDRDPFAKELRLAASLDRRAWTDFQHRKQQLTDDDDDEDDDGVGRRNGNFSKYNSGNGVYRELSHLDDNQALRLASSVYGLSDELPTPPGAVGLTVIGDTVSIQSNSSFPYGDENPSADYLPQQSGSYGSKGVLQGSKTETYMTPGGEVERSDSNGGWRMTQKSAANLNASTSPGRSSKQFSFLYHSSEQNRSPEAFSSDYPMTENASDPTSAGAVRGSPMSQSWSTNPRPGSSTENGTTGAVRGSPQSSSWNSISRPLSSGGSPAASPGIGSTSAVNDGGVSAVVSEEESMLTTDIVQEVQRLSQFVKSYEKKKENRMKRERERQLGVNLSASVASSLDYDNASRDAALSTPIELTKKINTSSTRSITPNQSLSDSPERNFSHRDKEMQRIESMPSSDSSDIETMESDDLSRRLGIHPFSVQKPAGYKNPDLKHPTMPPPTTHGVGLYQATNSPRQSFPLSQAGVRGNPTFKENTPRLGNKSAAAGRPLSSLRHSDAILDGSLKEDGPSDESTQNASKPFPVLRDPRSVAPRRRSQNQGFNSLLQKFDGTDPIYPPSETWQYEH